MHMKDIFQIPISRFHIIQHMFPMETWVPYLRLILKNCCSYSYIEEEINFHSNIIGIHHLNYKFYRYSAYKGSICYLVGLWIDPRDIHIMNILRWKYSLSNKWYRLNGIYRRDILGNIIGIGFLIYRILFCRLDIDFGYCTWNILVNNFGGNY